ncbi:hypothetical protein EZS27_015205 [termite gut metagenome]|uniref:Uncharacterized protein n=1 Tax=termite gut metagenome TaxID=433724 RepID=A0A5J4RSD3_9ZZZZ
MSIGFIAAAAEIGTKIAEIAKVSEAKLHEIISEAAQESVREISKFSLEKMELDVEALKKPELPGHNVENSARVLETFLKEERINYYFETPLKREEMLCQLGENILSALDIQDKGIKIIFKEMPPNSYGVYNHSERTLTINQRFIENPELLRDAIDTIIHEARHAYQHCAVETFTNSESYIWAGNFRSYIRPEWDFEDYEKQPVEVDARNFAASVVEKALNNILYG